MTHTVTTYRNNLHNLDSAAPRFTQVDMQTSVQTSVAPAQRVVRSQIPIAVHTDSKTAFHVAFLSTFQVQLPAAPLSVRLPAPRRAELRHNLTCKGM